MFDVSFTELLLIGAIALVVIGPERLPKVARTVGHLLGRAQRYVTDVKKDIQKEMDLDELNSLKGQMEEAAKSVQASMKEATTAMRQPLDEAQQALKEASASVDSLVQEAKSLPADSDKDDARDTALAQDSLAGPADGTAKAGLTTAEIAAESPAIPAPDVTAAPDSSTATPAPVPAAADQPEPTTTAPAQTEAQDLPSRTGSTT